MSWKKNLGNRDVLDLCDDRRDLKMRWYKEEGAKANKGGLRSPEKEKEDWIDTKCRGIDA